MKVKTSKAPTKTIAEQVTSQLNASQESASVLPLSSDSKPVNEQSEQAEILPDYSGLDEITKDALAASDSSETNSEEKSELASENSQGMTHEDCMMFASGGVGKLEWLASAYVGTEVEIPTKHKEDIATKAAVVIKKHFGDEELPPWLKQYKEEISLGMALGVCAFSIYRQKKAFDADSETKSETGTELKAKPVTVTDEMVNDVYPYSMSGVTSAS